MKLGGISFSWLVVLAVALFVGAVLVDADQSDFHRSAHRNFEIRGGKGKGGGGGSGQVKCKKAGSGSVVFSPVGSDSEFYAAVRDDQLIVGPAKHRNTAATSGTFFWCTSSFLQTVEESNAGWFQVGSRCITVDASTLSVTLEACVSADGPEFAKQAFVTAHDSFGGYAKFLGAPIGQPLDIGFRIDDSDPQGLIVAVQGKGEVILALEQ